MSATTVYRALRVAIPVSQLDWPPMQLHHRKPMVVESVEIEYRSVSSEEWTETIYFFGRLVKADGTAGATTAHSWSRLDDLTTSPQYDALAAWVAEHRPSAAAIG